MKYLRYVPLLVILAIFFVHNKFFTLSEEASLICYLLYFSIAMLGAGLTIAISCRRGLSGHEKHARIRFWSLNIICTLLIIYSAGQFWLLSSDFFGSHEKSIQREACRIESNDVNLHGYYLLQQVHIRILPKGDMLSLSYLLRSNFLKVGQYYKITYGVHSGYILSAEKINNQ